MLLFITAILLLFFLTVWIGLWGRLPGKKELASIENYVSSEVYAEGGELLGKYFIYDRTHVNLAQVSENVINSLIATEDVRFYQHKGIDYRSLGRVLFRTILQRESSAGGGSTLSQQLAKNLYPRKNNGIFSLPVSKLREFIIAHRLEKIYSKDDILVLYLNTVPFGDNVFGISAASLRFFNKDPYELTIEEAAVLIGMLKATNNYNPRRFPERATERRNTVIGQLKKYEYINKPVADSLMKLPLQLNFNPMSHNQGPAPYFREKIRQDVERILKDYNNKNQTSLNLYTDGLRIYTTLDYSLQKTAEEAVKKQMPVQQKVMDAWYNNVPRSRSDKLMRELMYDSERYGIFINQGLTANEAEKAFKQAVPTEIFSWDGPQSVTVSPWDSIFKMQQVQHTGLVSIDPDNGFVKAWVGGNDFRFFQYDHVLAKRQTGSTFKPFVYATALEMGIDPCEYVANELVTYEEYDDWTPENISGIYEGFYSMTGALAHSVNTVSAWYINETGILPVIEHAHLAGIHSQLPPVPSLALGTANISLLEMTTAYASFLKEGQTIQPVRVLRVEDNEGNAIFNHEPKSRNIEAWSESTALLTREMLRAVVDSGTAGRLRVQYRLNGHLAGKTGTTQNNADTWFIGFTPELITGVWTGVENPAFASVYGAPMSSSASAVPLWGEYHMNIQNDKSVRHFNNGKFTPLPDSLARLINCDMYVDELPSESWWESIFGSPEDREQRRRERRQQDRPSRFRQFLEDLFSKD
ncbi:MAG: transglycosylase domain-containing protein [Bacteroidales bacterium]